MNNSNRLLQRKELYGTWDAIAADNRKKLMSLHKAEFELNSEIHTLATALLQLISIGRNQL